MMKISGNCCCGSFKLSHAQRIVSEHESKRINYYSLIDSTAQYKPNSNNANS